MNRPTPYRGTAGRRDREDDEGHAWSSPTPSVERDLLLRAADAIEALDGTSIENEKLVDDYRAWRAAQV